MPVSENKHTDPVKQKLNSVVDRINLLLERQLKLMEENQELKKERVELQDKIKEYQAKIGELDHQLKTLKLAKQADFSDEKTDLKLKVNEYIREIDKCIAMLNK
jgi:chromosome segregation ATPase